MFYKLCELSALTVRKLFAILLAHTGFFGGDTVELIGGILTDGTVFARGSKKANGKYLVKELAGGLYAVRKLREEFVAQTK